MDCSTGKEVMLETRGNNNASKCITTMEKDGGKVQVATPSSVFSYRAVFAQSLMAGAVFLLTAGCGMPIGFSAILLPQIQGANSSLPTSEEMGSWIASIHSAATPLGSILSGPFMESWGRRMTLKLCVLPFVAGWTCMALATNHVMIFIARILAGFAVGLSAAPSQVLLGEVAEPRIRGIIVGAPFVAYSMGILLVYALGSVLPWRTVAAMGNILPLCALIALFFLPESPHWLARVGRGHEALKALTWLRGGDVAEARSELSVLAARQEIEDAECLRLREKKKSRCWNPFRNSPLFSRSVLKPLLIVNTFNVLQILSGTFTIIFYAVSVIEQAAGGEHQEDEEVEHEELNAAVLTALVRTIVTAIACGLLLWVGRRRLAISSGLSSALFLILLGCYIYVSPNPSPVPWFPAVAVLAYVACNTFGFFVLPGLMLGEMLPAKARGPAGGFSFTIINVSLFITTKLYPQALHLLQPHGLFWFFGGATLAATLFVFLFVPETRGQSLIEIEDYFTGNNYLWIKRRRSSVIDKEKCVERQSLKA